MAVKIRLSRHGRKARPFYYIVVADERSPRDGRFIEKLGTYNPVTHPFEVKINFESALSWLQKGAIPTDTCRSILSREGVLMKNHLLKGVTKGAFSTEEAERRFEAWQNEKELKLSSARTALIEKKKTVKAERLEAERKVKELRADKLAKKRSDLAKSLEKVEESTEQVEEAPVEDTTNE